MEGVASGHSDMHRTDRYTFTTYTSTTTKLVRVTPVVTVTTSNDKAPATMMAKRQVTDSPVDSSIAAAVPSFVSGAVASGSTSTNNPTFVASLSSACSCLPVTQSTVTATYTDQEAVSFFLKCGLSLTSFSTLPSRSLPASSLLCKPPG